MMQALFHVCVRGFEPRTDNDRAPERKKALVDMMIRESPDLDEKRKSCVGKQVFVDVHFFLFNKTTEEGRYQKDCDNLLKVALDTLQVRLDKREGSVEGLGLIQNDKDIMEIHCSKSFVENEDEEGLEMAVYDANEVKVELKGKWML